MLNKLISAKQKQYFSLDEWGKRGLNQSNNERQQEMHDIIIQFIDLNIETINTKDVIEEEDLLNAILYIENGVYKKFDTEEKEWVSDICLSIAADLGLDTAKIVNKHHSNFQSHGINDILSEILNSELSPDDPLYMIAKNTLALQLKYNNEPIENIIKLTGLTAEEVNKM